MNLSIVVPIFNDTATLPELVHRIFCMAENQNHDVEIVIVDDGSENDAWQRMKVIKDTYSHKKIILLRLSLNYGQSTATLYGLAQCHSDTCVTLDADLQHSPEDIPLLIERLVGNNLDLVYGSASAGHPVLRRTASRIFKTLTDQIGRPSPVSSAFRAVRKSAVIKVWEKPRSTSYPIDIALQEVSRRIETIETPHKKRAHGNSTYSLPKLIKVALSIMMTSRFYNIAAVLLIFSGIASLTILETTPTYSDEINVSLYVLSSSILILGLIALIQKAAFCLSTSVRKKRVPVIREIME